MKGEGGGGEVGMRVEGRVVVTAVTEGRVAARAVVAVARAAAVVRGRRRRRR